MTPRFRIRTSQGQELSFASHEIFEEFVRSGDLAPDDLVYDAETGEWAPSRTHPLVLEIEYAAEEEAERAKSDAAPDATAVTDEPAEEDDPGLELTDASSSEDASAPHEDDGEETAGDSSDFGLDLAPVAEGPSPEEEAAAFVEKMESERAMSRDFGNEMPSQSMQGFRMEDANTFADMVKADPEPEPEAPKPPEQKRAKIKLAAPKQKKSPVLKIVAAVVGVIVLGGGALVARGIISPDPVLVDPGPDSLVVQPDPPPPPAPEPQIASNEESVRERAQERFLSANRVLLDDLQPIPDAWLTGDYFSLPSNHADVRAVWQEYRTTVRDVRSDLRGRYRTAYESALDDAGIVQATARTGRTSAAMADFELKFSDIDAHWDRVDALARAAIQSHDALLGEEGLIMYDATRSTGRAEGIGAGTSGRNSDTQLLLDQVIDLVERSLQADGLGPREGANVREWVWGGFLDVVTR